MKLLLIVLSVGLLCLYQGVSGVGTDGVSVMDGDSVTLNTGVIKTQQDRIRWYYNDTLIAQINGDLSKICTDVQCKGGDERFRDRLKLDHHTGSLTITNITNTHSGVYLQQINHNEKTFSVVVHGAKREEVTRKEGESVTLDSGVINNPSDVKMWYFKDILIAEFTGDQNKTCTDVQCKKKFGDRLNLDPQTGSLNITNTTTEDSGEYRLCKHISISSSGRRRRSSSSSSGSSSYAKRFEVTVTGSGPSSSDPGSGLSVVAIAGIVVGLLGCVAAAAAGVIYYRHRGSTKAGKEQPRAPEEIPINVDVKEQPRAPEESPMNE